MAENSKHENNKHDVLQLTYAPQAHGDVAVPGSKSIANRALLLAALAEGTTVLEHMLDSDDTKRMREALTALGVGISSIDNSNGATLEVTGVGGLFAAAGAGTAQTQKLPLELFLGNAGTAMRPLVAMLAASAGEFILTGEPRMYERPIGPLVTALQEAGARIEYLQEPGYPPLRIIGARSTAMAPNNLEPKASAFQNTLHSTAYNTLTNQLTIDGSMSSQYVSALLMLLPFLGEDAQLSLTGEIVSEPYIALTVAMMGAFGVTVERPEQRVFRVVGKQHYRSPKQYWIEGDASSASYFLAAGAIAGGPVTVHGVGTESLQGDKQFAEVLAAMGANVEWQPRSISVSAGANGLQGGIFDLNHIPDAAMTIATTALFATGSTEIRNVANWRLKETDRLHAMATELRKTGAEVAEGEDWLRITPPLDIQHAQIATYDDHRMAMCFALLTFAKNGVSIEDPNCCRKTYPHFFSDLSAIVHSN